MTDRFHATEEITTEQCICTTGHMREDCPYAITGRLDNVFAEKKQETNGKLTT